jgi:branched-chain amino acid transport system permease protein
VTDYRAARFWAPLAVLLVLVCAIPLMNSPYITTFTFTLIIALVVAQSWDWVGGQMGFINLGHFAFYGIGGYTFAILLSGGTAIWIALAAALIVSLITAVIVSFPLFRLRGDYFAFATLALLPLCQILAFNLEPLTGGSAGIPLPPHYVLVPAYYLALGVAVVTFIVSVVIDRVRFGYALKAIRNDEGAAALSGVRILPVKVAVLALSAVFAGLAGAVQTWQLGYLDPPSAFGLEAGLIPIAMALLGGSGLLLGPLLGVIVLGVAHHLLLVKLTILQTAVYGAIILLVGRFMPGGLLRAFGSSSQTLPRKQTRESKGGVEAEAAQATPAKLPFGRVDAEGEGVPEQASVPLLECRGVSMVFGGNRAVNNVSLRVQRGEIIGLVGPNGSGKTTLFNCISKVYEPPSGDVLLNGRSLRNVRPDAISRLGVGRTYQLPRPFSDLTVEENVLVPLLFRDGVRPPMHSALSEARDIAAFAGLGSRLAKRADELSLQEKKALEFARALACKPKLLLVDEVASGLTPAEVRHFVDLLRQVRDVHGVTIIWVEHIFWALAELVERLIVMENGAVIADGPLREVVRHDQVLRAYLGSQAAEAV